MINYIEGNVAAAGATWVVVNVGGLGLKCLCTPATTAMVNVGQVSRLATSLVVREDSLTLYGFATADERDTFELVQSASGIGPKIAQAVVSVLTPDDLRQAIAQENLATLCKVPGIGRKGAQKLVLELKDKVGVLATVASPATSSTSNWRDQVQQGLEGLGWSSRDAEAACERVAPLAQTDPTLGVGELMKAALRSLAK